jgi:hypothetical protein
LLWGRGAWNGDASFEFKKVADGVHVAVAAPAYKVNCNTAIIENDDGVIVVDTHFHWATGTATRCTRRPIPARRS